jgi:uncharacterized protein YxeA
MKKLHVLVLLVMFLFIASQVSFAQETTKEKTKTVKVDKKSSKSKTAKDCCKDGKSKCGKDCKSKDGSKCDAKAKCDSKAKCDMKSGKNCSEKDVKEKTTK